MVRRKCTSREYKRLVRLFKMCFAEKVLVLTMDVPEFDDEIPQVELFNFQLPSTNEIKVNRNRQICTCGHSANMHNNIANFGLVCTPPTGYCGCKYPLKAMEVSNGRYFFGTAEGQGVEHPLAKNVGKLVNSGGTIESFWSKGCMICSEQTKLSAFKFSFEGYPDTRGQVSLLICSACEYFNPPMDLTNILTNLKSR